MQKLLLLIQKNPSLFKYGLGIVTVFAMIVSIRTYLNYLAIETSIENVNQETITISQRKLYEENFLIPYEESEYADFFLRHENNLLIPGEFMIKFEEITQREPQLGVVNENLIQTPQESWRYFVQTIRKQY